FDRIDRIRSAYGPGVSVQVTGGDPTLRRRDELVAIVRRVSERGLRPSLFTNGIKATRDLLEELVSAGLFDVAFHVDTTQRRPRPAPPPVPGGEVAERDPPRIHRAGPGAEAGGDLQHVRPRREPGRDPRAGPVLSEERGRRRHGLVPGAGRDRPRRAPGEG